MSTALKLRPLFTNLSQHGSKKQVINLPGIYFNKWANKNNANRAAQKKKHKMLAEKTRRNHYKKLRSIVTRRRV